MALDFPDGFPFNRRETIEPEPVAAPAEPTAQLPAAPVVAASTPVALFPRLAVAPTPVAPFPVAADAEPDTAAAPYLPAGRERRRVPRQTLVAKATVRSESQAHLVASGFVSNISMNGVGFHTRKPLRVGEKYQLKLEVGPMRWSSRLRIVTCAPHDNTGTFDVGAEFVGNDLATITRRELAA